MFLPESSLKGGRPPLCLSIEVRPTPLTTLAPPRAGRPFPGPGRCDTGGPGATGPWSTR